MLQVQELKKLTNCEYYAFVIMFEKIILKKEYLEPGGFGSLLR